MIVKRKLPHGQVPSAGISDGAARSAVMRMSENISALAVQLSELQVACQKMERDLKAALAKLSLIGPE